MNAPDPDAPSHDLAAFAADLRRLRLDADSPTLARLQHDTGLSRTVISDAFAGKHLPTARTVDGIVRALDADPAAWVARRDELAGVGRAAERHDGSPARPARASHLRWAGGAFLIGAVAAGAVAALVVSNLYAPRLAAADAAAAEAEAAVAELEASRADADAPQIDVHTGDDPGLTACVDDAEVATGDTRVDNSLLEIVWSDACQAGWGRITRYDGLAMGNTVTIAIYPETSPDGPARQEATEHDVSGAYTFLVVRPSRDTLLCAEGSFTVDGKRIDLGDPICI